MKALPFIVLCATAPILHAQPEKPETEEVAKDQKEEKDGKSATIAEVLGKPVKADRREELSSLIYTSLLEQYAKEHKIEATAEEVKTFLAKSDEMGKETRAGFVKDKKRLEEELKSTTLTEDDRARKEQELAMTEDLLKSIAEEEAAEKPKERDPEEAKMAREFVRTWKINRALFKQYGGRVIFQQAGPEPLDAYRDFFREQETKGAFRITDEEAKKDFWKYFTDESIHTFLDAKEGEQAMEVPWWLKQQKPEE